MLEIISCAKNVNGILRTAHIATSTKGTLLSNHTCPDRVLTRNARIIIIKLRARDRACQKGELTGERRDLWPRLRQLLKCVIIVGSAGELDGG